VPVVLAGSMTDRKISGAAHVGSSPTKVLAPVTLPVNDRTSAFAGKAPASSMQAMAVRTSLRISSSWFRAGRFDPAERGRLGGRRQLDHDEEPMICRSKGRGW
jgi:hypothetical protein